MTSEPVTALAVVIPALNAALHLPRCLTALEGSAPVIVADGGSTDATPEIARAHGAAVVCTLRGRGTQLAAGAEAALANAHCDWLLFLHADTVLEPGWRPAVDRFVAEGGNEARAAVFQFAVDDDSAKARRLTAMVHWRVRWLALPYGDQGLLIHRALYRSLGGYKPIPLMEDVDIIRRIGRRRLSVLPVNAITSAERWHRHGWWRRSAWNLCCLGMYFIGIPPRRIARLYD